MDLLTELTQTVTGDVADPNSVAKFENPAAEAQLIYDKILSILKNELADPKYNGLSDQEAADLLNAPDPEIGCLISQLFMGVPYAPNAIDVATVQKARA